MVIFARRCIEKKAYAATETAMKMLTERERRSNSKGTTFMEELKFVKDEMAKWENAHSKWTCVWIAVSSSEKADDVARQVCADHEKDVLENIRLVKSCSSSLKSLQSRVEDYGVKLSFEQRKAAKLTEESMSFSNECEMLRKDGHIRKAMYRKKSVCSNRNRNENVD
eukprot:TRINITY_DN248_c0_g1_i3.p1 TRINITY_DN248_c0_g1~~TRINITY_DN248_c0_g1_i3.p1  ORF type:complete len:167 (+),score=38.56 TRINITY_DN248_c0_g1_i3:236-736(+)